MNINKTLEGIKIELKKLQETKDKLFVGANKKNRVFIYKKIHRVEDALKKAVKQLSQFGNISHLL